MSLERVVTLPSFVWPSTNPAGEGIGDMTVEGIELLWAEAREVSLGIGTGIERLDAPPTPIEFLRNYVSQNKPCIITNAISHWPALARWPNHSYLRRALSTSTVSLHLTPDGRADSLVDRPPNPSTSRSLCFASAHVERVPFPTALDLVLKSDKEKKKLVGYLQQQNDCFRTEYSSALGSDCEGHIPWATEALGSQPEAVNLWVGNHLSETSFHKDHYENLYAVVSGEKHFLLLPPTDVHRMYIRNYAAAYYSHAQESGELRLEMEEPVRFVPWCSVDPYPTPENLEREMAKFPLYFNGPEPFRCTVKAGEILYLPSMWFHHVRQSPDEQGCTIAINYWYDMQFDIKYAYFNFLQSVCWESGLTEASTSTEDSYSDVSKCNGKDDASAVGVVEANENTPRLMS